jgi:hypothetical protein
VLKILLADADVNALAATAMQLRRRGLSVSLANGTAMAVERAKQTRFDVIVAANDLAEQNGEEIGLLDTLAVELGRVPPFVLLVEDPEAPRRREQVLREDIEALMDRIRSLGAIETGAAHEEEPAPPASMITGVLSHTPLAEFLSRLGREKKTGTLTVTTGKGAGELCLHDGEIADAVYLRLEGPKALSRLLGEREGTYTFLARTPPVMRRIFAPTVQLLADSVAEVGEAARHRASMGDLAKCALVAAENPGGPTSGDLSDVARIVLARLRAPATVDEILDDVGASDTEVLRALIELDAAGRVRRLSQTAERVPIARSDQLHAVRALAARANAPGFVGAGRLLFAGTPARLAVFAHSVLSIAEANPPLEAASSLPIPYTMGTLRFGDDVALDLVALPLVPVYAPLWPMTFAGSAAIVRLDDAAASALAEACATVEVPLLDVATLVGSLDEGNAAAVAGLVRAALEGA